MQFLRVVLRSWLYFWPMHATVACGVAAATAVLTGALLVGDSVRGSLRDLTLDRLGHVEEDPVFRSVLPRGHWRPKWPAIPISLDEYSGTVGAMLFPQATARTADANRDSSRVASPGGRQSRHRQRR